MAVTAESFSRSTVVLSNRAMRQPRVFENRIMIDVAATSKVSGVYGHAASAASRVYKTNSRVGVFTKRTPTGGFTKRTPAGVFTKRTPGWRFYKTNSRVGGLARANPP